jgi:hypothetical protein
MRNRLWPVLLAAAVVGAFSAGRVFSQDAYEKLGAPGAEHKSLAKLVGDWTVASKVWDNPGAAAKETKAHGKFRAIMGGRFIVQDYEGESEGKPFTGMGIFGYDNAKQKYTRMWIDSGSTTMSYSEGTDDGKSKTYVAEKESPGGRKMTMKQTIVFQDDDHFLFTFAMVMGPDEAPREMKMMELAYTRKK